MFSLYASLDPVKKSDKIEVLRSDSKEKIRNWVMENRKSAVETSEFSWTLNKGYNLYFWIDKSPDILVI